MMLNAALYLMGRSPDDDRFIRHSTLTVSVRADSRGNTVTIDLTAEGPARIAGQPLQRSSNELLAAVKQLAQQQGCDVTEEASSSGRTALRLVLPASEDTPRTVLVLDDNPDVGELLHRRQP